MFFPYDFTLKWRPSCFWCQRKTLGVYWLASFRYWKSMAWQFQNCTDLSIHTFNTRLSHGFITLQSEFHEKSLFFGANLPIFGQNFKLVQLQIYSYWLPRPKKNIIIYLALKCFCLSWNLLPVIGNFYFSPTILP